MTRTARSSARRSTIRPARCSTCLPTCRSRTRRSYQAAVESLIVSWPRRSTDGRWRSSRVRAAQAHGAGHHRPALTQAGITVFAGGGGSRHQLLETFKTSERTVLLGTRSFWEGVDVVGSCAERAGARAPAVRGAERPHRRGAQRDLRRPVLPVSGARGHPALSARVLAASSAARPTAGSSSSSTSASRPRATASCSWRACPSARCTGSPLMNLPAAAKAWVEGA
jgi:hypothetical protein